MSAGRVFTDAELGAYLDGEMESGDRTALEAQLADDPPLRRRLEDFRADQAQLKAALDPVLAEPVPEALMAVLASDRRGWPRYVRYAAAAAALFAAGLAVGYGLPDRREGPPDLARTSERALDAHLVYVPEVRHPVEVTADERDHLVAWLSKRLGHPLSAPDLESTGFRLIGGRLLPGEGAAAAQFMYEEPTGIRATLYVALNPEGRQTAFRLAERGGTRAFYWLDGPFGYAITADVGEDRLLRLAHAVYDQTSGGASAD